MIAVAAVDAEQVDVKLREAILTDVNPVEQRRDERPCSRKRVEIQRPQPIKNAVRCSSEADEIRFVNAACTEQKNSLTEPAKCLLHHFLSGEGSSFGNVL